MIPQRKAIGPLVVALAVVVVLVVSAFGILTMANQGNRTDTKLFSIQAISLELPQNQPSCQGYGFCLPSAQLAGTVHIDATSPLSCLHALVNGVSEGYNCWNLVSPGFPHGYCSGSGNQTSCTTMIEKNNNTQTDRTVQFSFQITYGSSNDLNIRTGQTYSIVLVAQLENNSTITASTNVVATVGNYSVQVITTSTCTVTTNTTVCAATVTT